MLRQPFVTITRYLASLSLLGLLLGALALAASLTPSMIPRTAIVQGVLSGVSFAAGYGIGALVRVLWRYLQLREPGRYWRQWLQAVTAVVCSGLIVASLWQASAWQNSILTLMAMEPVTSARPFLVFAIAALVALLLLLVVRLFRVVFGFLSRQLNRIIPRRLSLVLGLMLTSVLFWLIGNGMLIRSAYHSLDATYQHLDALIDTDMPAPSAAAKTGSSESLIDWESIGRQGRNFIAAWPAQADIEAITGKPALEPLRVYVGLNSANTADARAALALAELKRIGAFDRSVLVIGTPTGTGWMDPAAFPAAEILHHGDSAFVSVQYSYLPSWLSLIAEPEYGEATARAVYAAVYGYWTHLPKERRPKLYLFGLSLGALNSSLTVSLFDLIEDPFQGAVWVGPPFASANWRRLTASRSPGSPAWLPQVRDGSLVRFTAQKNALGFGGNQWAKLRVVYLQYASDAIVFFEPSSLLRQPAWMKESRGPDVSPSFRWYPVVTFLQTAIDMMIATNTSVGHGHVYAAEHYVDAWFAVTEPSGWDDAQVLRLKHVLTEREASSR